MLRFHLGKVYGMSDLLLNIHKDKSSFLGTVNVPLWSQHNLSFLSISLASIVKLYQPGSMDPWLSILYSNKIYKML